MKQTHKALYEEPRFAVTVWEEQDILTNSGDDNPTSVVDDSTGFSKAWY